MAEMGSLEQKEKESRRVQTVSAKKYASLNEQIASVKMEAECAEAPIATDERTRDDTLCFA